MKVEGKHIKLISITLILSIIMQILMPIVIPLKSLAAEQEAYVETELGKLYLKTDVKSLNVGDIVPVEIYIEGTDIFGIVGYIDYDRTIFRDLEESDIEVNASGWNINGFETEYFDQVGYYFEMSHKQNVGTSNFTACTINLEVIQATEETTVSANYVVITDINDNDTSGDGEGDSVSLTIKGQAPTYNIIYDENVTETNTVTGMPSDGTKEKNVDYIVEAGPTREGYTFAGWNTAPDGTGISYAGGDTYSGNADVTLYAQWKTQPILTVNPNGGTWEGNINSQTFRQDEGTTKTINNPSKTPDGNIISFNPNGGEYTGGDIKQGTTFNGWDGATLSGTTYTFGTANETLIANYKGDSIILPTATRTGYKFKGWKNSEGTIVGGAGELYEPEYTTPGARIRLTAEWNEEEYTLTIDENGGTYIGNKTLPGKYKGTVTVNTPTKTGYTVTLDNNDGTQTTSITQTYTFSGWTASVGNINENTYTFAASDATLTANYSPDSITLPIPTRAGYIFNGWYTATTGGIKVESPYIPTSDITLYAQWTFESTLTVNPNGGAWEGSIATQSFTQNEGTTKEINNPTTTPNGNIIKFNANGGEVNKLQENQNTTFNGWTGAILSGTTYTFGTTDETLTANYVGSDITLPVAIKIGTTFIGWEDEEGNIVGGANDIYAPKYTIPNTVITLTAKYEEIEYTLTINANGGTYVGNTTEKGKYNSTVTVNTPTKTGYTVTLDNNDGSQTTSITQTYTFSGWTASVGNINENTYTFVASDATLTANYSPDSITLPIPTRAGYVFNGWYTDATGGIKVESPYTPQSNITLYAQWTFESTLTVNPNGGEWEGSASSQIFTQNEGTTKEINNPTAPNGNIIKFDANGGEYTGGDITQTTRFNGWTGATLSGTTYTFGTTDETLTANYVGESITLPSATKIGSTFLGWEDELGNIVGGANSTYTPAYTISDNIITLTAKYEEIEYTLTIDTNGGEYVGNTTERGKYNSTVIVNTPTKTGYTVTLDYNNGTQTTSMTQTYTFNGWEVTAGSINENIYTFAASDATLTANYTVNELTLPTATREGYIFNGWYTEATGGIKVESPYIPAEDITLYAQWICQSTLTIDPNGGEWEGSIATQSFTQNEGTTKEINNPTTPNGNIIRFNANGGEYTGGDIAQTTRFNGWTGATLSGTTYTFGTTDVTLTANYVGESITLPSATKIGSTFLGWEDELGNIVGGANSTYTPAYTTSDNIVTLTAKYEEIEYTLTIDTNGGEYVGNTTEKGKYNSTVTVNTPTKTGYTVTLDNNDGTQTTSITQTYTFSGWEVTAGSINENIYTFAASDAKLIANYTVNELTLPTPTREKHIFNGWYTAKVGGIKVESPYIPQSNITLYAQWTVQSTLTIDPNGGVWEGSIATQSFIQNEGTTKEINNPTTPNGNIIKFDANGGEYTGGDITQTTRFNGWTGATLSGTTYTFGTTDETLTANYVGESITLPSATKIGSAFLGWEDEEGNIVGEANSTYTPAYTTSDNIITLTAKYEEIEYTLTINPNGGEYVGNTTEKGKHNSTVTINTPTKTGYVVTLDYNNGTQTTSITQTYTFNGWEVTAGNINENTYTFAASDATLTANYTVNELTLPTATREGYIFNGWYTETIGGIKVESPYTPQSDITLYAQWICQSTLTVDPNGGVWEGSIATQSFTQNEDTTKIINNPTKTPNGNRISFSPNGGQVSKLQENQTTTFSGWTGAILSGTTYTFGITDETLTASYEGDNIILPAATKVGSTFLGWEDEDGNIVGGTDDIYAPAYTTPNAVITLTAKWEEEEYELTIDENGGEYVGNTIETGKYKGTVTVNTPTKTGYVVTLDNNDGTQITSITQTYTFDGWTASAGNINENTYTFAASDATLTANYTANEVMLPTATRVGYIFNGWYTAITGGIKVESPYTPQSDITLYAQWIVETTLTVDPNGGIWEGSSYVQSFTEIEGTTKEINNPTTTPNGNIIRFNANGGEVNKLQENQNTTFNGWAGGILSGTTYTFGTTNETLTANYEGDSIILPAATKVGSTFLGWEDESGEIVGGADNIYAPAYTTPNAVITLTAKWVEKEYTLTIDPNGGTYDGNTIETGKLYSAITVNEPRKTGYTVTLDGNNIIQTTSITQTYTFNGWTASAGNINGNIYTFAASDATLTANYTLNELTLPTPTSEGYVFNGWYTAATGGVKIENPYTPISDITLYAQWTIEEFVITFDVNGGNELEEKTKKVKNGETYGTLPIPTRDGYEFKGWEDPDGLEITDTTIFDRTSDVTLYAVWEEILYLTSTEYQIVNAEMEVFGPVAIGRKKIIYDNTQQHEFNDGDKYIIGIIPQLGTPALKPEQKGTTAEQLINNITTNGDSIKIYKKVKDSNGEIIEKEVISTELIGTNMRIEVKKGDTQSISLELAVSGDVNSNVTITDENGNLVVLSGDGVVKQNDQSKMLEQKSYMADGPKGLVNSGMAFVIALDFELDGMIDNANKSKYLEYIPKRNTELIKALFPWNKVNN